MPFVRGHVQYSSRFNIVIRTLWAVLSASIVSCSIICLVLLSGFISPLRFHWCSILPSQPFLGPVEFCIWYFFGGFRSLQSGCGEGLDSTIIEFAQSWQAMPIAATFGGVRLEALRFPSVYAQWLWAIWQRWHRRHRCSPGRACAPIPLTIEWPSLSGSWWHPIRIFLS